MISCRRRELEGRRAQTGQFPFCNWCVSSWIVPQVKPSLVWTHIQSCCAKQFATTQPRSSARGSAHIRCKPGLCHWCHRRHAHRWHWGALATPPVLLRTALSTTSRQGSPFSTSWRPHPHPAASADRCARRTSDKPSVCQHPELAVLPPCSFFIGILCSRCHQLPPQR